MSGVPPEEDRPIYQYGSKSYRGEAVGGPFDGQTLTDTVLTMFYTKPYKSPVMPFGSTLEEHVTIEKKARMEYERYRSRPHRYDFDVNQEKWIYVEYETE